jgi:hypothetical protein
MNDRFKKKKIRISYDEIDLEIRELCKALNRVPDIMTTSCCSGHGKHPAHIWLKCASVKWLNRFMWAGCRRWFCIGRYYDDDWTIQISNGDTSRSSHYINLVIISKVNTPINQIETLTKGINKFMDETNQKKWIKYAWYDFRFKLRKYCTLILKIMNRSTMKTRLC